MVYIQKIDITKDANTVKKLQYAKMNFFPKMGRNYLFYNAFCFFKVKQEFQNHYAFMNLIWQLKKLNTFEGKPKMVTLKLFYNEKVTRLGHFFKSGRLD